jgi:hypothetical protein
MNKAKGSILEVLAVVVLTGCASSSTAPAPPSAPPATNLTEAAAGITVNAAGAVLPNHARTPGALNPLVTEANIATTICVSGWTATIRPPSSFTTGLKVQQLASGYTYKGDRATKDYEEDHLISLEIGGPPTTRPTCGPSRTTAPRVPGSRTSSRASSTRSSAVTASLWQRPSGLSPATSGPPTRPTWAQLPPTRCFRLRANDNVLHPWSARHERWCSSRGLDWPG